MESITQNLIDEEIVLPNLPLICTRIQGIDVFHENKTNHKLFLSFKVSEPDKSAKIYCLSMDDFEQYAIQVANQQGREPSAYQFVTEKTSEVSKLEIPLTKTSRIYFLIVKKSPFRVPLRLNIDEKWDPKITEVGVLPNIPHSDNRLSKTIRELINNSKKTLKIISPYTDLHLMDDLTSAINRSVNVKLIIRNNENSKTQSVIQAFPRLQKLLKENLRSNNNIHARILISDVDDALVMSSDISQDSMQNLINCGIHITDSVVLTELNNFFDKIWEESKNTS